MTFTGGGTASAAITQDTIWNGVLSITPFCQGDTHDWVVECTKLEKLTEKSPIMLDLNPITTNIVVLGAGLYDNGTMRPVLINRLQAALALARKYPTAPIIVSGGVPRSGVTEAAAMHRWLRDNGVWDIRITEENTSRSTVENANNTSRILNDRGATGAVVVTSPDHLQRAMINFRDATAGRVTVAGVVAPYQ